MHTCCELKFPLDHHFPLSPIASDIEASSESLTTFVPFGERTTPASVGSHAPIKIKEICGTLVTTEHIPEASMYEVVHMGRSNTEGEIIGLDGDTVRIECFKEKPDLAIGDSVVCTGLPRIIEVGPGVMDKLSEDKSRCSDSIMLDHSLKWEWMPSELCVEGSSVRSGDVMGFVQEGATLQHQVSVPPNVTGIVKSIEVGGIFTLNDIVVVIVASADSSQIKTLGMSQMWPTRCLRNGKLLTSSPLFGTIFPPFPAPEGKVDAPEIDVGDDVASLPRPDMDAPAAATFPLFENDFDCGNAANFTLTSSPALSPIIHPIQDSSPVVFENLDE
jgi:hypothetical protein